MQLLRGEFSGGRGSVRGVRNTCRFWTDRYVALRRAHRGMDARERNTVQRLSYFWDDGNQRTISDALRSVVRNRAVWPRGEPVISRRGRCPVMRRKLISCVFLLLSSACARGEDL